MRNTHCRNWNMARNSENLKCKKYTLCDLDFGDKTEKRKK